MRDRRVHPTPHSRSSMITPTPVVMSRSTLRRPGSYALGVQARAPVVGWSCAWYALALVIFAFTSLSTGCGNRTGATGCESDDECLLGRVCVDRQCVGLPDLDVSIDVPDADVPDADVPDADVPDADVPDADVPDADVPWSDVPGPDYCLEVDPVEIDFGVIEPNASASRSFALRNCGRRALEAQPLEMARRSAFGLSPNPAPPAVTIAPGEVASYSVVFAPEIGGVFEDYVTVLVHTPEGTSSFDVALRGLATGYVDGACIRTPPSVNFGQVLVGMRVPNSVVVENCGSTPVRLIHIELSNPENFSIMTAEDEEILPGARAVLQATFSPEAARFYEASLLVGTDVGAFGETVLLGRGVRGVLEEPCLEVVPENVDFGDVPRSAPTEARSLVVRNCGSTPTRITNVRVTGRDASAFVVDGHGVVGLDAGASVEYRVTLDASFPGPKQAAFRVDAMGDEPNVAVAGLRANVVGASPGACIAFTRPAISFASAMEGSPPLVERVELVNCGDFPVTIVGTDLVGDRGFTVQPHIVGETIRPGRPLSLRASFDPVGSEGSRSATFSLFIAEGGIAYLPMTAHVFGGGGADCVSLSPADVAFGSSMVGDVVERLVDIVNCGDTDIQLRGGVTNGDGHTFFDVPARTLAPGQRVIAPFYFSPSRLGPLSGRFGVETQDLTRDPFGGTWSGFGASRPDACATLTPNPTDFGVVPTGRAEVRELVLENCGAVTLPVGALAIDGSPAFQVTTPPPASLSPGAQVVIRVVFRTDAVGTYEGLLTAFFGGDVSASADLRAAAADLTSSRLVFSPSPLTFGRVRDGASRDRTLTMCNEGGAAARVRDFSVVGADAGHFSLQHEPGLIQIPPDECATVRVTFAPVGVPRDTVVPYRAMLHVSVADSPEIFSVELRGQGEGASGATPACLAANPASAEISTRAGQSEITPVLIRNCGAEAVQLRAPRFTGAGTVRAQLSALVLDPNPDGSIPLLHPGEELLLAVQFTGNLPAGSYVATLIVDSPAGATVSVPISLHVTEPFGLCFDVSPSEIDFGTVDVGDVETRTAVLRNCGEVPLNVRRVSVANIQSGSFGIAAPVGTPFTLAPGATRSVQIALSPAATGEVLGRLDLETDLAGDAVPVSLRGFGRGAVICPTPSPGAAREFSGPYASSIEVPVGAEVFLDAGLVGPGPSTVSWSTTMAPPGASVTFTPTPVEGRVQIRVTVQGDYRFRMRYTNSSGCEGVADVNLRVRPATGVGEGLRIVITWRTPGDPDEFTDPGSDVDLHLARRTSSGVLWNTSNDCYYANRTPTWGVPTDLSDNPRLLRDETQGLGPEIIVLENPWEQYYIAVHYFSDSGFGPSDVTLRIFWDGIQVRSATRRLTRTNDVWLAAEISDGATNITMLDYPIFRGFPASNIP